MTDPNTTTAYISAEMELPMSFPGKAAEAFSREVSDSWNESFGLTRMHSRKRLVALATTKLRDIQGKPANALEHISSPPEKPSKVYLHSTPVIRLTQPGAADGEEIDRVRKAEETVEAILKETKSIIDSIAANTTERQYLKEKLDSLCELKRTHSMLLMDNATLQDFTAEVSALHTVSIYLRASIKVKSSIRELKETLQNIYGSSEMLEKVICAHIVVPTKEVEMGDFVVEPSLDWSEYSSLILDEEDEIHGADEEMWQSQAKQLLVDSGYQARAEKFKAVLDKQLKALEFAEENLVYTVEQVENIRTGGIKLFEWFRGTVSSVRSLTDLVETTAEVSLFEVDIWRTIANGGLPSRTEHRQKYHDAISKANICFDRVVQLGQKSPLPRDLLGLLTPSPSLHSSELKEFEALQQKFIKWGNVMMSIVLSEAAPVQPASIHSFDFRDMLWRPFAHTWLLRRDEERRLIGRTNVEILLEEDKEDDFVEALKRTDRFDRPSIENVPVTWHLLPDDSKVCSSAQEHAEKVALRARQRVEEKKEEKRKVEAAFRVAKAEVQKALTFLIWNSYQEQRNMEGKREKEVAEERDTGFKDTDLD